MSAKHQAVLVNDPECFVKPLPSMRVTAGTDVPSDDAARIVVGFTPDVSENEVFRYIEATGIYGDRFEAKRHCTIIYSGVVFRDTTTGRGSVSVTQGDVTADYGQVVPTVFSSSVAAPSGDSMFGISGIATLQTGEAISFMLDNDSGGTVVTSMVLTSVNPA